MNDQADGDIHVREIKEKKQSFFLASDAASLVRRGSISPWLLACASIKPIT